nr:MAG TPA: hypothetical protein [Caudoviricetes sp.]
MPLSKRNLLFYLETTAKKCILGFLLTRVHFLTIFTVNIIFTFY